MSVMRCSRRGCENIMCDRYSSEHGYICHGCFDELVAAGVGVGIGGFMETKPAPGRERAARAYFDVVFPNKGE